MSDIPYSVRGGRATTSVAGLTDTTITNLLNQQILKYDSASQKWINAVDGGGDATISSLGDTLISNPLTNQSLVYNATVSPARWENQVTPFTQSDFTNAVSTDAAFINHKPIISTTSSSTMVGINTGVNKEGDLTAFGKGAGDSAKSGHICIGQISGNLGATRAISLGYNTHSTHNNSVVIHGGAGMGSSATNAFYIDPLRSLDALTQTVGDMKINMYNTSTKEIFLTDNLLVPGKTKLNGALEVSNGLGTVNQVLTSNNTGALTWTDKSQLSANIYDLGGLTWSGVSDNELIRRTSSTTADGTGMSITDINNLTDNKKTLSFFNRVSSLIVPLGLIDYSYNISSTVYKTHLSPKSSHATTSNGLFLQATSTVDPVKVGINVSSPSQALQVGTTLYVDDTNKKVGIGIITPTAQLEVDGSIQIDSAVEARLKFHYSGASAHALSEITAERDPVGGNGGDLHFYTKVDGGNVTEKLRINNIGAIGLGATPDYGTAGQFLKTNNSGSAVSWGNVLTGEVAPLYVDIPNLKVGIGIVSPMEKLDVDSIIQITAPNASTRASLYFNHISTGGHDLASITSLTSGTNGGDLQFWTTDNGSRTQKITINEKGALGIGATTPNYGTAGQFLKTNNSGSSVSWDTPTNTTYTNGSNMLLVGTEFNIPQSVATTASPSFTALTLGNTGTNQGVINLQDVTNTGRDTVANVKGFKDGTNGGDLQFFTKVDGGNVTEKLRINNEGKLGFRGNYGTVGQYLKNNASGLPEWTTLTSVSQAPLDTPVVATPSGTGNLTLTSGTGFNSLLTFTPAAGTTYTNGSNLSLSASNEFSVVTNPTFGTVTAALNGNAYTSTYASYATSLLASGYQIYIHNAGGVPELRSTTGVAAPQNVHVFYAEYAGQIWPSDDRIKWNETLLTSVRSTSIIKDMKFYQYDILKRPFVDKYDTYDPSKCRKGFGVIAQEVEALKVKYPELSDVVKNTGVNGDIKAVNYNNLFSIMGATIQSLIKSVETLEAKVKTLESK